MKSKQTGMFVIKDNLFRRVFESNPMPMWIYDLETLAFLAVNDAAVHHYGYSREEFLSMTVKDIHPEEISLVLHATSKRGSANVKSGSWKHRRKDGTLIDVELASHEILFGNRQTQFVMINDVTHSRRAVEALSQSEEKYRDLFENANDSIFIVDSDFRYIDANRKAIEVLGYSKDELLTMKVTDIIPPEQIPQSKAEFEKLRDCGAYEKFIGKVKTKDGRLLDVEISSSAIIDDGQIIGSRDIMRDITERKRMEEDLLRAQKLESVGILAGGIAHDFNNLLTAILGNISLAKMDSQPGESIYERLEEAEKASYRAQSLTQQLLTFSRGGAPIKKNIVARDLVQETVTFSLRGTKTLCEFIVPDNLWSVEADEGQLSQVFNNLAINASQAMPDGGKLSIQCSNIIVTEEGPSTLPPGKYVQISFRDRGVGIPSELFEKIFDPYFTTRQKGSGLGLATSYSIIKKHGGYITVESELGTGSTFSVYLPASLTDIQKEREMQKTASPGAGNVLIVDDEEIIRDVASKILVNRGYNVECAQDGQMALVLYTKAQKKGSPFDAVIMDLTIPGGMGGKETIKKLLEIDPQAKVIVSSGYSNDPIMAEYQQYGFKGVVAKPYTVQKLSETIRQLLNR
jgi:two-component system cell cycle sensor histidine kinase/response regulator CckA